MQPAQGSTAAAEGIKVLIEDSVDKVTVGPQLEGQAGTTRNEILGNARKVTDIINEITSASQEKTAGIEQINQAIMQMDDVTQQNASLVKEAAAASRSLQDQDSSPSQIVKIVKLDMGSVVRPALAASPPCRAASAPTHTYLIQTKIIALKNGNQGKRREWAMF